MRFVRLSEAQSVPRQSARTKARKLKIYLLVDPRDAGVRYVGKTSKTLGARLEWHLRQPTNAQMAAWFRDLAGVGLRPHIEAIEFIGQGEWEDAERGWIFWFRERGDLLNVDPGGNHRDRNGRVRGTFTGRYQPPAPKKVARGLWEAVHFPMKNFAGQQPRKSVGGGARGTRRYAVGDPGS